MRRASAALIFMLPTTPLVLNTVLGVIKPLIGLLVRHGVAYPAFAAALKKVFLQVAQEELRAQGSALTDSAISVLSGVHRRDVRELLRPDPALAQTAPLDGATQPMSLAMQVVARWLTAPEYLDADGNAQPLARATLPGGFDALVASISCDVRPRAVLGELLRLGIAQETEAGVQLLAAGFAPQQGFAEMAQLMQSNVYDHIAAASDNIDGRGNFLEQAIFVDQITEASAQRLHTVSSKAWRQALKTVMQEASARFAYDQLHASAEQRSHRARFGGYFYSATHESNHDKNSS